MIDPCDRMAPNARSESIRQTIQVVKTEQMTGDRWSTGGACHRVQNRTYDWTVWGPRGIEDASTKVVGLERLQRQEDISASRIHRQSQSRTETARGYVATMLED